MAENKGRIAYVEPNNIHSELTKNNVDNLSWNAEDFGIFVDLQVVIPERDNCGAHDVTDNIAVTVSSSQNGVFDNWNSFMKGTPVNGSEENSVLTTEYTDISYQEISNNRSGGKEALGIQSIDIQFDSHFFPIVTMKMIDVRGFSLMQPEEERYVNNLDKEKRLKTCQSFFSALFHFPYPRFSLTVKGFYGDPATFMLAVDDFNSSFNSGTGNFEATIKFIGHMYGVYSDIPFNYLLIAPYIGGTEGGTNEYWRKQVGDGGTFHFTDGTPIPTYIETLGVFDNMPEKYEEIRNSSSENYENIEKIEELKRKRERLQIIVNEYNRIIDNIGAKSKRTSVEGNTYIVYFCKNKYIDLPSTKKLNTYCENYNKSPYSESIKCPECFNTGLGWGIPNYEISDPLFTFDKESSKFVGDEKLKNDSDLYKKLEDLNPSVKKMYTYIFEKQSSFVKSLLIQMNDIDTECTSLLNTSSKELTEISTKVLGYSPTLENTFRMFFAHMDAFMHSFYKVLSEIQAEKSGERLVSNFQGLFLDDTDLYTNGGKECWVPPFPEVTEKNPKNKTKTRIYPGEKIFGHQMREVDYVEEILSGMEGARKAIHNILSGSTLGEDGENPNGYDTSAYEEEINIDWSPLTVLDYIYEEQNPYSLCVTRQNEEFLDKILSYMITRFNTAAYYCRVPLLKNVNMTPIHSYKDKKISTEVDNMESLFKGYFKGTEAYVGEIREKLQSIIDDSKNNRENELFKKGHELPSGISEGFNVVSESNKARKENYATLKADDSSCTSDLIDLDWSYGKRYKTFRTGIFITNTVNGKLTIDNKKNEKKYNALVKSAREDKANKYFPFLQVGNGLVKKNFLDFSLSFKEFIEGKEIDKYIYALKFLSCFIGTTDILRFSKLSTSLVRMPKFMALYLGGVIWRKKTYPRYDALRNPYIGTHPFMINKNGIFDDFEKDANGNFVVNGLTKINGLTIDDVVKMDEKGNLSNYFVKWVDEEFSKIMDTLYITVNGLQGVNEGEGLYEKVSIKGETWRDCFKVDGKASSQMMDFFLEEADVVLVKKQTESAINYNEEAFYNSGHTLTEETLCLICEEILERLPSNTLENEDDEEDIADTEEDRTADKSSYSKVNTKNEIYYTLKNLYDKWLSTYTINKFKLKAPSKDTELSEGKNRGKISDVTDEYISEFNNFMYIDTFYNNIGDKFLTDPKVTYELIVAQKDGTQNRSALQFMWDTAEKNKLLFIALPVFNNMYDAKTIGNIFTPQSIYNGIGKNPRGIGNTYVLMYTHEPSNKLNNRGNYNGNSVGYCDDAWDIADSTGSIAPMALADIESNTIDGNNYTIPAFGVTFAKQNQMYFKGINVSMENPRVTDVSLQNKFLLAEQGSKGASRGTPTTVGQNLFSIYSNRSYDCTVEMMGCANIMPLMYFQLNNVPMFKGAYRVVSVKHHIEAGTMTTSFSGTRVSKRAIPFNDNVIDIESLIEKVNAGEVGTGNTPDYTYGLDFDSSEGKSVSGGNIPSANKDIRRTYDGKEIKDPSPAAAETYTTFNVRAAFDRSRQTMVFNTNSGTKTLHGGPWNKSNGGIGVCVGSVRRMVNYGLTVDGLNGLTEDIMKPWETTLNGYYANEIMPSLNFKLLNIPASHWIDKNGRFDIDNEESNCKGLIEPGDIAFYIYEGHEPGHGCIYLMNDDAEKGRWISDFNQNSMWCYTKNPNAVVKDIKVFRFNGKRIMPSGWNVIKLEVDNTVSIKDNIEGKTYTSFDDEIVQPFTEKAFRKEVKIDYDVTLRAGKGGLFHKAPTVQVFSVVDGKEEELSGYVTKKDKTTYNVKISYDVNLNSDIIIRCKY